MTTIKTKLSGLSVGSFFSFTSLGPLYKLMSVEHNPLTDVTLYRYRTVYFRKDGTFSFIYKSSKRNLSVLF